MQSGKRRQASSGTRNVQIAGDVSGRLTIIHQTINAAPQPPVIPESRGERIAFILQTAKSTNRMDVVLNFAEREFSTRMIKDLDDEALFRVCRYTLKVKKNGF